MAYKIIVCAKQVPNTNEIKTNPETGTLIRDGVESILNHDDANALEEALKVKDAYPGTTITVITMGPPQAQDMLMECIAMGADESILISDRAVGGSDTQATSNALVATIKKAEEKMGKKFDLVFAGRQAIDGDTAQVGPQIAEKLDLPQVTYVEECTLSADKSEVTVKRNMEDGYEIIKVKLPCMLTAIKELNTPRYMTIEGIFSAKEKPMHVWSAADVEVDLDTVGLEASPTNVFRSFTPAPKGKGEILTGNSDKEVVEKLLIGLKGKHVI